MNQDRPVIFDELSRLGPPLSPPARPKKPSEILAYSLATIVLDRWTKAGVTSWMLDANGFPIPAPVDLAHDVKEHPTEPHQTALFFCARCAYARRPIKVPPRGVCKGIELRMVFGDVMAKLLLGGRYDVDAKGLPIPSKMA